MVISDSPKPIISEDGKRRGVFHGWYVLAANCVIMGFSSGVTNYGATVFFNPVSQALGISKTVASIAISLARAEKHRARADNRLLYRPFWATAANPGGHVPHGPRNDLLRALCPEPSAFHSHVDLHGLPWREHRRLCTQLGHHQQLVQSQEGPGNGHRHGVTGHGRRHSRPVARLHHFSLGLGDRRGCDGRGGVLARAADYEVRSDEAAGYGPIARWRHSRPAEGAGGVDEPPNRCGAADFNRSCLEGISPLGKRSGHRRSGFSWAPLLSGR